MAIDVFRESEPIPRWRELTIVAQDPSVRGPDGRPLTAKVRVPHERLEPGPRGHRLHVVDYEPGLARPRDAAPVGEDLPLPPDLSSEAARPFIAQNVHAIAARTLATFEAALGRRVQWGFPGHHLYLVPTAFDEANAFYAEDDHALYFGYVSSGRERAYTALSHDIVAHETAHAILDGLRDRYDTPGLPDQAAFHEAFADITALLSAFAVPGVVARLLGGDPVEALHADDVREQRLGNVVGTLAEEFGRYVDDGHADGLRNSYRLLERIPDWRALREFEEPHRRGEVLVAAVIESLVKIWRRRLQPLIQGDKLDRARAAEEGAVAATHLLKMCIRSLDYLPPLEFEFEDFIDGLIVADEEVEPDDEHGYRPALLEAFRRLGIERPTTRIVDLSGERRLTYAGFNYLRLRSDPDEVFRFIWENADVLEIPSEFYTHVEHVRQVMRVGFDGFIVADAVVDYFQRVEGPAGQVASITGMDLPDVAKGEPVALFGGGVLVFDQFGRAKYHQRKALIDQRRQSRRLEYLVRTGRTDSRGRYGFSEQAARGQRFAELHRPAADAAESW